MCIRNGRNTHFLPNSFEWVQKQVWETGKKAPEWNFRVGKGGYWEQSRRRRDIDKPKVEHLRGAPTHDPGVRTPGRQPVRHYQAYRHQRTTRTITASVDHAASVLPNKIRSLIQL